MQNSELILASTSKTRQLLLSNAGIAFTVQQPLVNEKELQRELVALAPQFMVVELARAKALSVSLAHPQALVIGADQILAFENKSMHKANNLTEARRKLQRLRGQTHLLHSSFACAHRGRIVHAEVHSASLTMRNYSDEFIDQYLKTSGKDILSSVGCYFIEGLGIQLFETVEGDYSTILGLPILPLLAFLRRTAIIAS